VSLSLLPQPSISGPRKVGCGRVFYGIPKGAGAVQPKTGLLYVLYMAKIHCFVEAGEVELPNALRSELASRYFGAGRRAAS
jgi:hypothetical protein